MLKNATVNNNVIRINHIFLSKLKDFHKIINKASHTFMLNTFYLNF